MRAGYAAEDGAALHFVGAELERVVASRPAAGGYRVDAAGERVVETRLATAYLGEGGAAPVVARLPHCPSTSPSAA
jgi:hypothetical protein